VSVDTSGWTAIGRSDNADFYQIEDGLLAVVPFDGCVDDAATARQSVQMQHDHLQATGRRAAVLVFMDRVVEQNSSARAVYRDMPDPALVIAYALIGGTAFGRAVASIFIGISPPRVPTKMFGSFEDAVAWARGRRDAR